MIDRLAKAAAAATLAALLASPAAAQTPPDTPNSEAGRYSFAPVEGGVMRLDSRTGAVSHCTRRPAGWTCETAPDERAALDAEIARLTSDNQRLSARVAELERRIEQSRIGPPPVPPGVVPDPTRPPETAPPAGRELPSDAELDRVMTFVEKLFRRFMAMVQTLRPEPPPQTPPPAPNSL